MSILFWERIWFHWFCRGKSQQSGNYSKRWSRYIDRIKPLTGESPDDATCGIMGAYLVVNVFLIRLQELHPFSTCLDSSLDLLVLGQWRWREGKEQQAVLIKRKNWTRKDEYRSFICFCNQTSPSSFCKNPDFLPGNCTNFLLLL